MCRKKVWARKFNITSSSAAGNKGAVVREAEMVQRPLTQDINQFGQVQYQFILFKLNSHKNSWKLALVHNIVLMIIPNIFPLQYLNKHNFSFRYKEKVLYKSRG